MTDSVSILFAEKIEKQIYFLRGYKVMLSTHLADLYKVEPRVLVQAVKRNIDRFPEDFMFQLTQEEFQNLKSQIVISKKETILRSQIVILKKGQGKHLKYLPYAFTEQGIAMLSTVLKSKRAVQVNIEIMRAFVRLRQILGSHRELARKLEAMEKKYDGQFKVVFEAIRQLMESPKIKSRDIGFHRA